MNKISLVLRHEILSTITRKSYFLVVLGIPFLGLLVFFFFSLTKGGGPRGAGGGNQDKGKDKKKVLPVRASVAQLQRTLTIIKKEIGVKTYGRSKRSFYIV